MAHLFLFYFIPVIKKTSLMEHSGLVYIYCFSRKTAFLFNFTFLYFSKLHNFWWSSLVTKYHKTSDKVEISFFLFTQKIYFKRKKNWRTTGSQFKTVSLYILVWCYTALFFEYVQANLISHLLENQPFLNILTYQVWECLLFRKLLL